MGARTGVMLAKPYEKRLFDQMSENRIVQPKINGQRCRAVPYGQHYILYSSQGNEIKAIPHINAALFDTMRGTDLTFDGEIYLPGMKVQDISGICRTQHYDPRGVSLQFHIFDLINEMPQIDRLCILNRLMLLDSLVSVPYELIHTEEQFFALAKDFVSMGYEGAIVRDGKCLYTEGKCNNMLKYKPLKTDRYQIVGFQEECDINGWPKKTLGAINLMDKQGNLFKVGTGTLLTQAMRQTIWDNQAQYKNLFAIIEYPELTKRGVPHQPRITGFSDMGEGEGDE